MKINSLINSIMLAVILVACAPAKNIQNGDLLFVAQDEGNLSGAINRVTQTEQKTNYSHVGIVERTNDTIWVWDASPVHGTRRVTLNEFVAEQKANIYQYRLKHEYSKSIAPIWKRAEKMAGKPYNYSYIMNDSSYYCSDFIYRLFENDSIFKLNPMTFVNPQTSKIDDTWIKHYQKMGLDVPEGKPGCNPNGLAFNDKLIKIGSLEFPK